MERARVHTHTHTGQAIQNAIMENICNKKAKSFLQTYFIYLLGTQGWRVFHDIL